MSATPGVGTILPWEWSNNPPGPAPYSYEVPASLEVQPYTSTATFDGTDASGPFVPTLSLYSQTGALLASVFPVGVVMQPGDIAEVTWLPPFGSAPASQASATGQVFSASMNDTEPTVIPAATQTQMVFNIDHYASNDAGVYFEAAANGINIKQPGVYQLNGMSQGLPTDGVIGALVYPGDGTGDSCLGGGGDLAQQGNFYEEFFPATSMPGQQVICVLAAVNPNDITAGALASLWCYSTGGATVEADRNITVTRLGSYGTYPPSGYD